MGVHSGLAATAALLLPRYCLEIQVTVLSLPSVEVLGRGEPRQESRGRQDGPAVAGPDAPRGAANAAPRIKLGYDIIEYALG